MHDDSIPTFTPKLFYTDYPSVEFEHIELSWDNELDVIANAYHNANHTLSVRIEGNNFENRDYPIVLTVYNGEDEIYTKTVNINGTSLNNGYNIELAGLNLSNFDFNIN